MPRDDAPAPPAYTIRRGRLADIDELSGLFSEMGFSRLHELGMPFVRLLHRHIVTSPYACCFVAYDDDGILGYCSAALDTDRFTRGFKLRWGWLAGLILLPALVQPRRFGTIRRALSYSPSEHFGKQKVSTLTFAVRKRARRLGIGAALFREAMAEFGRNGIDEFTFHTAGDASESANSFYRGLGCEYLGTEPFYEDSVASVYRWTRAAADEAAGGSAGQDAGQSAGQNAGKPNS